MRRVHPASLASPTHTLLAMECMLCQHCELLLCTTPCTCCNGDLTDYTHQLTIYTGQTLLSNPLEEGGRLLGI